MDQNRYYEFVQTRAKWMPSIAEDLHHASTGIMGEVVEFLFAKDREEMIEELGDLEFYVAHFELATEKFVPADKRYRVPRRRVDLFPNRNFSEAQSALLRFAGELLDLTKKAWIYNKELQVQDFAPVYYGLISAMWDLHKFLATSEAELKFKNVEKLRKRYPDGYTDEAAQARADKA